MLLLTTEWSILLRTLQHRLPILLFSLGQTSPKLPPPVEGSWLLSIHGSVDLPKELASWLVHPLLQGSRMWPTDSHTDRLCYSVCSNTRHLAIAVQCSLIIYAFVSYCKVVASEAIVPHTAMIHVLILVLYKLFVCVYLTSFLPFFLLYVLLSFLFIYFFIS